MHRTRECWVEPQYNIEQVENTWPSTRLWWTQDMRRLKNIFWIQTTLVKKYLGGEEREKKSIVVKHKGEKNWWMKLRYNKCRIKWIVKRNIYLKAV